MLRARFWDEFWLFALERLTKPEWWVAEPGLRTRRGSWCRERGGRDVGAGIGRKVILRLSQVERHFRCERIVSRTADGQFDGPTAAHRHKQACRVSAGFVAHLFRLGHVTV